MPGLGRQPKHARGANSMTGNGPIGRGYALPEGSAPPQQIEPPALSPEEQAKANQDRLVALLASSSEKLADLRVRHGRTGFRDSELGGKIIAASTRQDELLDELMAVGFPPAPNAEGGALDNEFVAVEGPQGAVTGYMVPGFDELRPAA